MDTDKIIQDLNRYFAWLVAFTNSSQKISTQGLTVLIIRVIVHTEQRKREKKKSFRMFQITKTSPQRNKPQW